MDRSAASPTTAAALIVLAMQAAGLRRSGRDPGAGHGRCQRAGREDPAGRARQGPPDPRRRVARSTTTGATGVELTDVGEVPGTYQELEIENGAFVTKANPLVRTTGAAARPEMTGPPPASPVPERGAPGAPAMIRVENLHLHFGGIRAVDGVSVEIEQGSITGLIGPNGAGKTTLFNVIAGVYPPSQGRVFLQEQGHHRPQAAPALPQGRAAHLSDRARVYEPYRP